MNAGNALLSVYDKTGIVPFAKSLRRLGWQLYASGGTAAVLRKAKVPVTDVAELVGGQAILGHRVVTLSRQVHAGLLADKNKPADRAELKKLGIPLIDLVCVDLYPLEEAIKRPKATEKDITEKTDVGGPTMLHAAAKGRRIVISRPDQRRAVLKWLQAGRPEEPNFRRQLAAQAELEVADYIKHSAAYLNGSEFIGFSGRRLAIPKYGENPWQTESGLYDGASGDPLALPHFVLAQGAAPSYNNYADIDRLLQTITHIAAGFSLNYQRVPAIALGAKHGNVCGAAIHLRPDYAVKAMLDGDPRAIFGGVVMLNFPITRQIAELLMRHRVPNGKRLLDVVVAPRVTNAALKILARKEGKLRVMINPALALLNKQSLDYAQRWRYVRGGLLAQTNYTYILNLKDRRLQRTAPANPAQRRDMLLGWALGSTSNSNTITLVKNGQLLGNGVGQQDRVSAAALAIKRANDAGHDLSGATAYSDSFFPFPDGPETLSAAGIKAIFASRGSVQDKVVAVAMQKAKVAFYTLPDTAARGFYAH